MPFASKYPCDCNCGCGQHFETVVIASNFHRKMNSNKTIKAEAAAIPASINKRMAAASAAEEAAPPPKVQKADSSLASRIGEFLTTAKNGIEKFDKDGGRGGVNFLLHTNDFAQDHIRDIEHHVKQAIDSHMSRLAKHRVEHVDATAAGVSPETAEKCMSMITAANSGVPARRDPVLARINQQLIDIEHEKQVCLFVKQFYHGHPIRHLVVVRDCVAAKLIDDATQAAEDEAVAAGAYAALTSTYTDTQEPLAAYAVAAESKTYAEEEA